MHQALHVEEILVNIFSYCHNVVFCWPPRRTPCGFLRRYAYANSRLVALAGTCHIFKEPALNLIWAELDDLTPLIRCLPDTAWTKSDGMYTLRGPLEAPKWDIILSYARRIRALPLLRRSSGLAESCIEMLSHPPTSVASVFPNLRVVGLQEPSTAFASLLHHLINPQLTDVSLDRAESLDIQAFGEECPLVTDFYLSWWSNPDIASGLICHWPELSYVDCPGIGLTLDTLRHVSHSRSLIFIAFKVLDVVVDRISTTYHSPLTFSALRDIFLGSSCLTPVWKLLGQFRFPIIHNLAVNLSVRPAVSDLMSFYLALHAACMHHDTLNRLALHAYSFRVDETNDLPSQGMSPHYITFDRLLPLTVFVNIKDITFDMHPCSIDLSERELLSLVSSWPHLEIFEVGRHSDWTSSSALTPGGFLQLLERCRSLRVLSFMFDSCGYTEIPEGHPWRGLTMLKGAFVDFLHSPIEEESIEALGVFFQVAPYPAFEMTCHWNGHYFRGNEQPRELCDLYRDRWMKVFSRARGLWEQRRNLGREIRGAIKAMQ